MLFLELVLFLALCILSIEVLSKDIQRWDECSKEKSSENNFNQNGSSDEKTETGSRLIMNVLDPNNNPVGDLSLRLNGLANSLAQNEAMLPNINMVSKIPGNRAKLRAKAKLIKPSHNSLDTRNNQLSKNNLSRPKTRADKAKINMSVSKDSQKGENKSCRSFSLNPVNIQKEDKIFKNETTDAAQTLNYEDIEKAIQNNSKLRLFNLTDHQERQRVIFDTNYGNGNNTEAPSTIPKKYSDSNKQDTNEISDIQYTVESLTEALLEQNNYLKEILQRIFKNYNATRTMSSKSNTKRIHLILDLNNFGNKSVDIELKPILKLGDNSIERIRTPLADKLDWVKINASKNDVTIKENVSADTLDNHEALKTNLPYPYNYPVLGVSNQEFMEYKPVKGQGWYTYNNYPRYKVTPHKTNNLYLLSTDNKSTTSKLSKNIASSPYYKIYFGVPVNYIKHYRGYFKSPSSINK